MSEGGEEQGRRLGREEGVCWGKVGWRALGWVWWELLPPSHEACLTLPACLPHLALGFPAQVVELLCSELAGAFSEAKTPLPPWRQHAAMLSKWQPRRSEEVEVSAAILNNEVGLRPALDAIRGGRRKVAPVTGPATIAQRLAMLGVQQPSRVSPVAEGLEAGTDWSTSSLDESPGASSDIDAQDELEGDVAALEEEEEEEEDGAPGAAAGAAVGPAPLAKMLSDSVGPEAAQAACGAPAAGEQGDRKPSHIWQGIRKAVAALPQRR